jgi:hypothetical protein
MQPVETSHHLQVARRYRTKIAGVDFIPAEDAEDGAGEDRSRPITDRDVRDALERKGIDIRKLLNLDGYQARRHRFSSRPSPQGSLAQVRAKFRRY